jgi:hypothetical protein
MVLLEAAKVLYNKKIQRFIFNILLYKKNNYATKIVVSTSFDRPYSASAIPTSSCFSRLYR